MVKRLSVGTKMGDHTISKDKLSQPQTHHSSQKGHSELAGFVGMMVHTPIADQCLGTEGWFSEK